MDAHALIDAPECDSLIIETFVSRWRETLSGDAVSERLIAQLLPSVLDVASSPELEARRAWIVIDWMARTHLPAWLGLAGLPAHAEAVRELAPLADQESAKAAMEVLHAAKGGAEVVAASAVVGKETSALVKAVDAAKAGAREAASEAAWAALGEAVRAPWFPVRTAAMDAEDAAIWAASWTAPAGAIAPIVEALQASAGELVHTLCVAKAVA